MLSAGNPGAASRLGSLLGLRWIAFLHESGRRRASNANGRHLAAVCLFLRHRWPKKKPGTYFESVQTGKRKGNAEPTRHQKEESDMYRAHPEIIVITFLQFCGVERLKKSKPTKKRRTRSQNAIWFVNSLPP